MIKNNNLINEEYFDVLNECGEFTNKIVTREECHKKGLWHRAVYGFIFNKKGDVLLQKRAKTKKLQKMLIFQKLNCRKKKSQI